MCGMDSETDSVSDTFAYTYTSNSTKQLLWELCLLIGYSLRRSVLDTCAVVKLLNGCLETSG